MLIEKPLQAELLSQRFGIEEESPPEQRLGEPGAFYSLFQNVDFPKIYVDPTVVSIFVENVMN